MKTDSLISVVVPVRDGARHLARCLDAVTASDYARFEIIVVDDNSADASAKLARTHGARVVQLATHAGPAAARNRGAREAQGDVLLFVDADVEVRRDTLARVAAHFASSTGVIAAVFGSYDDDPAEQNFASQFKNLFHHFMHQHSPQRASTFWSGCGAIRRDLFLAVAGFDARRYARPSIEDIELGYCLRRAGFEIALDREMQVKHLKRWTLLSLLRADVRDRAVPWSRLILETGGMVNELNLRVAERISASLVCLAALLLCLTALLFALAPVAHALNAASRMETSTASTAPLHISSAVMLVTAALASLASAVALNRGLYRFFFRLRGARFAAAACAMHLLYFLYSGATFALCACAHVLQKQRTPRIKDQTTATQLDG